MTGEEYLDSRLERLRAEARALASDEYDAEEMWRFVRDAAAMFERFLQTATLSQPPLTAGRLFDLVNALEHDGVSIEAREALHAVRRTANEGKHDASVDAGFRRVDELLARAQAAVRELAQAGIPEVAGPYTPPYRRRFLIAVYDHPTGGESEFYIWPCGMEPRGETLIGPPAIETFQFQFRDEEAVRQALAATGDLRFGDVDADIVAALKQDSEFTECGYWEGAYRDLVRACAPHQHEIELLPGLARHDHKRPVAAALAMTVVDLSQPLPPQNKRPSAMDLLAHAAMQYAVRRRTPVAEQLARAVGQFVAELPDEVLQLSGPRFVKHDRYAIEKRAALHSDDVLGFAVLPDGTLFAEIV